MLLVFGLQQGSETCGPCGLGLIPKGRLSVVAELPCGVSHLFKTSPVPETLVV